jgi:hypothetical protein
VKKPPYSRPQTLSDPYNDWHSGQAERLLEVPDDKLEWHHYQGYLGPHLPAGTYEESVYFLPGAFRMLKEEEEHSLDLADPIIGFISKNASQLEADDLLESCRTEVMECLGQWTQTFAVIHFDRDACLKKGWKRLYFDYVKGIETVCQMLSELDRFEKHADLADRFITSLAQPTVEPTKSAWFLELVRSQNDVYASPNRPVFQNLFTNEDGLLQKQLVVEKYIVNKTASPTYWRDTFREIGLSY